MTLRSLDIEFAPFSWRRWLICLPVLSWVLLLFVVGLCILVVATLEPLLHAQGVVSTKTDKAKSDNRRLLSLSQPNKSDASSFAAQPGVREMVGRLNEPWSELLDNVEQGIPSSMALLSIELDSKTQLLKIVAEAKNLELMIDSVDLLQSNHSLTDVKLVQQETNEQDPNRPVRFHVEARTGR